MPFAQTLSYISLSIRADGPAKSAKSLQAALPQLPLVNRVAFSSGPSRLSEKQTAYQAVWKSPFAQLEVR